MGRSVLVLCPISTATVLMSTPAITSLEANLSRKQCQYEAFNVCRAEGAFEPGSVRLFGEHARAFSAFANRSQRVKSEWWVL